MPATPAVLGFLGHLNGISLKVENVSHDLLPPPTHLTAPNRGYALQCHTIQQSTRAALIEPEDKRLATGNPHRQPPATYRGTPEPKLQHTTVQKNQATRPTSPINSAPHDELPHQKQIQ